MNDIVRRFDPYEVLGVARAATAAEIRSAFRQKAKKVHPDAGGSAAAFAEISRAHLILADAARRARFDETGSVDDGADNKDQAALNVIMGMLSNVLMGDDDPMHVNLIAVFDKHLAKEIIEAKSASGRLDRALQRSDRATARFARKRKTADGPNQIEMMLKWHAAGMRQQQQAIKKKIGVYERAQVILREYEFTPEAREAAVWFTLGGDSATATA